MILFWKMKKLKVFRSSLVNYVIFWAFNARITECFEDDAQLWLIWTHICKITWVTDQLLKIKRQVYRHSDWIKFVFLMMKSNSWGTVPRSLPPTNLQIYKANGLHLFIFCTSGSEDTGCTAPPSLYPRVNFSCCSFLELNSYFEKTVDAGCLKTQSLHYSWFDLLTSAVNVITVSIQSGSLSDMLVLEKD